MKAEFVSQKDRGSKTLRELGIGEAVLADSGIIYLCVRFNFFLTFYEGTVGCSSMPALNADIPYPLQPKNSKLTLFTE